MSTEAHTEINPEINSEINPEINPEADTLTRQIDALSLRQSLLDFEMANARVLDLTARLVEANARVVKLQGELDSFASDARQATDALEAELAALRESVRAVDAAKVNAEKAAALSQAELDALRSSRTFRLARRIGTVAKRIRR